MDVKCESWTQQPMSQIQAGQDGTSDIAWRRSRDELSWKRPPRAARPHSCIEGRLKDEFIQTLNNLQICPLQQQMPSSPRENDIPESVSLSLVASSQSSLESLCSQLESKERVQIKTAPSTQRAKVCCLAPVRIGWLPLQRHVVKKEGQNDVAHQDGTSWKADGKRKVIPAERNKDTPFDRATSVQNTPPDRFLWQTPVHRRGSVPQVSLLTAPPVGDRTSPKHSSSISSITITSRKVIRSSSMPDTSISSQDRDRIALNNHNYDPDYSNSLCPTEVTPQRKALVVKITEQREETNKFLEPGAKNSPDFSFSSRRTTGETCFSTRMSSGAAASDLSSMMNHPLQASFSMTSRDKLISEKSQITHTECHSQMTSCLATQESQKPVVLRRKPTIIKVQEQRDSLSRVDNGNNRNVAYRHSFSGLKITDMKPQLDNKCTLSGSEMQAANSQTNLYRSTVSLQMTSSNQCHLDNPHAARGSQPRRPASCYASLFSPVEANAGEIQNTISVLPHETNIGPVCSTASTSNRCWSNKGGEENHDRIYLRTGSSSLDKAQSKRESDLLRNQPLTLIKVPESSTHETYDAIVALNAAAIIANIKLHSDQKKRTQSDGNPTGERASTSMSKPAGKYSAFRDAYQGFTLSRVYC
ncbi:centrosomal protein C10orf90-like isoform X2 [Silurus asotus]|uniref:Centrosomal protein C10orf90-like isoform X2 n=1 Tax=Silurus asotus TaxID=30991 RepID=A0AAD5A104_SILAS|nr:centrosomal protein C10orf90-like isoform X2 [Silurus asotus]